MKRIKIYIFLFTCVIGLNNAFSQKQTNDLKNREKNKVIATISELLITNYVFKEDAIAITKLIEQGKRYRKIGDPKEFASLLTSDIRSINNDQHLKVNYESSKESKPSKEKLENDEYFDNRGPKHNYGLKEVKILDGNLGYINITNFSLAEYEENAKETISSVMNFVKNCDALIFDMRNNPGGSSNLTIYLLSYLFDSPSLNLSDYYDRPTDKTTKYNTVKVNGKTLPNIDTYVLVNENTFSAPEMFAYTLKHFNRGTVIGEKTAGGAHLGMTMKIDDNFSIHIPTGRIINPITKTDWEQKGVLPNIETSSKKALITAQINALEKLNELNKRLEYENYIKTLKSIKEPLIIEETILSNYVGKYELAKDRHLTITKNCSFIYGQMTGDNSKIKLIALDKTNFKAENMDARIKFNITENGIVYGLTFSIEKNNIEATKTE